MNTIPDIFYKYREFNTYTLDSLCSDEVYFSNPKDFNDPFDCNPSIKCDSSIEELKELLTVLITNRIEKEVLSNLKKSKLKGENAHAHAKRVALHKAKQVLHEIAYESTNPEYTSAEAEERCSLTQAITIEIKEHYTKGVFSLAADCLNPLMWSHYADEHNGICIGYSVERDPKPKPQKAIYNGGRVIKTSVIHKAIVRGLKSATNKLEQAILLRKSREWRYEKEWRLIGSQGIQDSPLLLREIVFGLRCKASVKYTVVKALENRLFDVKFYEIRIAGDGYELNKEELNIGELAVNMPHTAQSGNELFRDLNDHAELLVI